MSTATLLAAPCVVANSGDRDGLPTVLLEAMALGTPVISTDVTGIPEVVQHRETGLTVPQRDMLSLADACQELSENRKLANQLAVNARQLIEQKFDNARTSAKLRSVWQRLPRRILFRIHNRRGMGHWMRSLNIATEILRIEPHSDLVFYSRSELPFPIDEAIQCQTAEDPDTLSLNSKFVQDFLPHVVIDDTILKEAGVANGEPANLDHEKNESSETARTVR